MQCCLCDAMLFIRTEIAPPPTQPTRSCTCESVHKTSGPVNAVLPSTLKYQSLYPTMYQRVGKGQAYRGCAQLALCVILDKQCMTTDVYFTRTRVMALHSRQNIITNLTVTAAHAPQHHDFSRVARQTLIFIKSLFTLCSRLYDRQYNRLDERFEYSYDEYINRVRVECCLFCD